MAAAVKASRFALLKIDDDVDSDGDDSKAKIMANKSVQQAASAKKKKNKKKRQEQQKAETDELRNLAFGKGSAKGKGGGAAKQTGSAGEPTTQGQWDQWKEKDSTYASEAYEHDLQQALLLSKLDFEEKTEDEKGVHNGQTSHGPGGKEKKKKKKEKPSSMSLDQFNQMLDKGPQGATADEGARHLASIISPLVGKNGYGLRNSADLVNQLSDCQLDETDVLVSFDIAALFTSVPVDQSLDVIHSRLSEDETLATGHTHSHVSNPGEEWTLAEENPSPKVVVPVQESDPRFFSKVEEDVGKILQKERIQEEYRKQYVVENVRTQQYQADIEKRDKEITMLKESSKKTQEELTQVKKRNQQLCHILAQGEMRDKRSVLLELEEMKQVREELTQEVTELTTQLEKERSKVHSLKAELDKVKPNQGGRSGGKNQ